MEIDKYKFPRIKDLPEEEQKPFKDWLRGQTCPLIEGISKYEQDAYYIWDYETWKAGLPPLD